MKSLVSIIFEFQLQMHMFNINYFKLKLNIFIKIKRTISKVINSYKKSSWLKVYYSGLRHLTAKFGVQIFV